MNEGILLVAENNQSASELLSVLKPFFTCQFIQAQQYLHRQFDGFPALIIFDLLEVTSEGLPAWVEQINQFIYQQAIDTQQLVPPVLAWIKQEYKQRQQLFQQGVCDYFVSPLIEEECLRRVGLAVAHPMGETTISNLVYPQANLLSEFSTQSELQTGSEQLLSAEKVLAKKLAKYLLQHLSQDISLSELARVMATNRNKLATAFKASYGTSIFNWMRKQRMHKAALLLCQSSMSILQVAEKVGYMDPNNFSTAFKREFQLSPKQYRQQSTQVI